MKRDGERSRIVFPALVLLALLLMAVPEPQIEGARARVLALLRPVLCRFAAWKAPAPRIACIELPPPEAPAPASAPQAAPPQTSPEQNDWKSQRIVQLESELQKYRRNEPFANVSGKPPPGVDANVIARKIMWQEPILGIDRGQAGGVRMNAGVLHRGAVLGRVVGVNDSVATVALLTHRGMSISARLADNRVEGTLHGTKDDGTERLCHMDIRCREATPRVGESVVTSGYDGAFPPGLWVGVVTAVKKTGDFEWDVTVRPACNDNAVEIVHVLTGQMPEVPWPVMPGARRK